MNQSRQNSVLEEVLNISTAIAKHAASGGYIFRGETQCWPRISSRLFRDYEQYVLAGLDVEAFQRVDIENAERFTKETAEIEILAELQHYGGATNLIDFTTDYLVALFFACDGDHTQNGRIILLDRTSEIRQHIHEPSNPENRIIAQKSVFVRPPEGYISTNRLLTVTVPRNLKQPILDHLRNSHGISTESIYNDLHGFIRYKTIHYEAFKNISNGFAYFTIGDYPNAIASYTQAINLNPQLNHAYVSRGDAYFSQSDFLSAVADYTKAIELSPNYAAAYYRRGIARLFLSDWINVRFDLTLSGIIGMDVVSTFRNTYQSVTNFQQRYGIQIPQDIGQILGH